MFLDATGLICPAPVLALAKAFKSIAIGDEISIIADDPATQFDVPAWCRIRQQELLSQTETSGVFCFKIRKLS